MVTLEEKVLEVNKEYYKHTILRRLTTDYSSIICKYCKKTLYLNKTLVNCYWLVLHNDCYKKFLIFPVLENEI